MSEFRILAALTVAAVAASALPIWAQAQRPPSARAPAAAAKAKPETNTKTADAPMVEPAAFQALQKMSGYLRTQTQFQMDADTSLDLVLEDGQKIKVDGTTSYKVRRPDGFVIEANTDRKQRTFVYDGKQLVVYAPQLGFYGVAPAKATIRETLDYARDSYGISLPLEDLFYWSDPQAKAADLDEGFDVGASKVDGVGAEHYAFRQGDIDWQIWIRDGDQPLPLKVVIVDRSDPSMPEYSAKLKWNLTPRFTDQTFAFKAPDGAKPIRFAGL